MNDLRIAVLLDEGGHVLDRSPSRDVPVIALAEHAIQQTGRTQKPHMAAMQRRDRTPSGHVLARHQKWQRLLPCTREGQQVFQEVIRKSAVTQRGFACRGNGIWFARLRRQLRQRLKAAIRTDALKLPPRLFDSHSPHIAANSKHSDLPEADRFFVGHTKDVQPGEVRTQDPGALVQALERDHQYQHALHHQPAEGVLKEQAFHAVVSNRSDLGIVGRIEIEQRERLGLGYCVEGIALDRLDAPATRCQRPLGIEFNPVTAHIRTLSEQVESCSLPHA